MSKSVIPSFTRSRQLLAAFAVSSTLLAGGAQAQILFDFNYANNTPGVGFLNPTTGAARQAALVQAGQLYSNLFSSYFTNTATIRIDVSSTDDINSPTLASAGSFAFGPEPGFGLAEVVRTKLVTGVDLNGAASDGVVDVNWGYEWELNPNTPAVPSGPGQTFDFYSAIFHEFTHALGFSNNIVFDGSDGSDGNNGTPGTWSRYDGFLVNAAGNSIIDGSTFLTNQATWNAARTSGVFFGGPNARAANGGNAVDLYSPNPFSGGSSIAHLNTDNPAYANTMMKHNRDYGPEQRGWSAIEVGILTDIGYVAVVPEPATVALLLAGLAGVVGASRRRQKSAA